MQPLLYLVHRIPYPPNKGDKIRSYNILRYLSQFYDIYLGTFIDTAEDEQYQSKVKSFCKEAHFEKINPKINKIKSLTGFFTNQALSIPYYASSSMQKWVDKIIVKHDIKTALAFSSPVAQYIMDKDLHKIMDFIDIDSDKWRQYSLSHKGIMSAIYAREAKYLYQYEKQISQKFDTSIFVSNKEAQHFKSMLSKDKIEPLPQIQGVSNGIDVDFFNPDLDYQNPYPKDKKILVFTGAMDYWANVDAVIWFAKEVFTPLYESDSNYQFYIVGSSPSDKVKSLSSIPGVTVTGRVEDIRAYLSHAHLAVAPLRIARGIQNKVLEAMAMNKVVIATNNAMEGIIENKSIIENIKNTPQDQIKRIKQLMTKEEVNEIGKQSGSWIKDNYQWDSVLEPLKKLL